MLRWLAPVFALCLTAAAAQPALAQDDETPMQHLPKKRILNACKTEIKLHCPRSEDTVSEQVACLRQYSVSLSLPCRHAVSKLGAASDRSG